MRRLVLFLALFCCGCEDTPQDLRVQLELSPDRTFRQAYRLTVADGRWDSRLDFDGAETHLRLTPEQLQTLAGRLAVAGAFDLPDGDCGDPEPCVLYTHLVVRQGQVERQSLWRGLPEAHARVAQALLDSPVGEDVWRGLEAVRARKAGGDGDGSRKGAAGGEGSDPPFARKRRDTHDGNSRSLSAAPGEPDEARHGL